MRIKLTNFENGEPLFSLGDVKELTFFTANIARRVVKDTLPPSEYEAYIRNWCDKNNMPDEIYDHICIIVRFHNRCNNG
jgi:hypothetical protein